jgi:branched-chain amino acid transport system ATP-binding protein
MGLAPTVVDAIFERIRLVHRQHGLTVLLVEQRVVEALESCDRGYVLETGRVALSGSRDTLMTDPRVRRAYLGM